MAQPSSLHEHAVEAERHLEALATGLAGAGADEGAIKTVQKMADVTRQLVKALGKGQEESGDDEPPAPEEPSPEEEEAAAAQGAPAPAPKRRTIQSATEELRREAQRRAARG